MENKPEIGDVFVVDWQSIARVYPKVKLCKFPDKKFIIKRISHSGQSVYFDDFRTNRKCDCQICGGSFYKWEPYGSNYAKWGDKNERSISISQAIVVEKRLERERELKLKLILGK